MLNRARFGWFVRLLAVELLLLGINMPASARYHRPACAPWLNRKNRRRSWQHEGHLPNWVLPWSLKSGFAHVVDAHGGRISPASSVRMMTAGGNRRFEQTFRDCSCVWRTGFCFQVREPAPFPCSMPGRQPKTEQQHSIRIREADADITPPPHCSSLFCLSRCPLYSLLTDRYLNVLMPLGGLMWVLMLHLSECLNTAAHCLCATRDELSRSVTKKLAPLSMKDFPTSYVKV